VVELPHIEASPRKERSASIEVAMAFVEKYRPTYTFFFSPAERTNPEAAARARSAAGAF
jgi:hypothetical protein